MRVLQGHDVARHALRDETGKAEEKLPRKTPQAERSGLG